MFLFTLFVLCLCSHGHCHVTASRDDAGLFEIIQQIVYGQQVILERVVILQNEISDLKAFNMHMEQQTVDQTTFNIHMEQQIRDLKSVVADIKTSSTNVGRQVDGFLSAINSMEQRTQTQVCQTNCQ